MRRLFSLFAARFFPYNQNVADELTDQLAVRDRFRRKLARLQSPAERVRNMMRIQKIMWATLRSSPEGYAYFLRRNFKARAIDVGNPDAR
jgi:hypothetical protein